MRMLATILLYAIDLPGAFFAAAGGTFTQIKSVQKGDISYGMATAEVFGCFLLGYCAHAIFRATAQFDDPGMIAAGCIIVGIIGSPLFRIITIKYFPMLTPDDKPNDQSE